MSEKDYAETLHLPKTDFQMKGNLPNKEPNYIKKWEEHKIYEKGLAKGKESFILHDGPPYANGNTHIGHALNKIDRKSTRLNSSHANISYAVFCLKKKKSL